MDRLNASGIGATTPAPLLHLGDRGRGSASTAYTAPPRQAAEGGKRGTRDVQPVEKANGGRGVSGAPGSAAGRGRKPLKARHQRGRGNERAPAQGSSATATVTQNQQGFAGSRHGGGRRSQMAKRQAPPHKEKQDALQNAALRHRIPPLDDNAASMLRQCNLVVKINYGTTQPRPPLTLSPAADVPTPSPSPTGLVPTVLRGMRASLSGTTHPFTLHPPDSFPRSSVGTHPPLSGTTPSPFTLHPSPFTLHPSSVCGGTTPCANLYGSKPFPGISAPHPKPGKRAERNPYPFGMKVVA